VKLIQSQMTKKDSKSTNRGILLEIRGIHEAQLLTYMKLLRIKTNLLINLNLTKRMDGIKRYVL
jgi:hypothetical protein